MKKSNAPDFEAKFDPNVVIRPQSRRPVWRSFQRPKRRQLTSVPQIPKLRALRPPQPPPEDVLQRLPKLVRNLVEDWTSSEVDFHPYIPCWRLDELKAKIKARHRNSTEQTGNGQAS